ncbi:MAG TPA: hypothetical protein VMR41_05175, partial [Patescibacteria group bacterium]|nr:hypothetical protein [Patescibacteria group bacterium]
MNYNDNLETLKSIKRHAKASYSCLRSIYLDKLTTSSHDGKKVLYEAISALDAMHQMYETLKNGMRQKSIADQIGFVEKWNTYVSCVEALTAYRTNDKYLLNGIKIDKLTAEQNARKIWYDYS